METYFASPQKATPHELVHMVESVNNNLILNSLLQIVDGCLVVLNEHRQIITVNKNLLNMLGIDDAETVLGLRPGEAIGYIHAEKKSRRMWYHGVLFHMRRCDCHCDKSIKKHSGRKDLRGYG